MVLEDERKEIIELLMNKKVLVDKSILEKITLLEEEELSDLKDKIVDASEINKERVIDFLIPKEDELDNTEGTVEVISSYEENIDKKKEVNDFVLHFRERYKVISNILRGREELSDSLSINRLMTREEDSKISIIGLIFDKSETKNGNIILEIEDLTGSIRVIITKRNEKLFNEAKDLVPDEVIGIVGFHKITRKGNYKNHVMFGNELIWPDIPLNKELRKSPDDAHAIFLSDIHIGSIDYLPEKFDKFCSWLNGDFEMEQEVDVTKIKYLFLVGDVVEGIGIYPDQDKELVIKDIKEQYAECARILKKIPSRIKIIICPGNHDATALAEPQPRVSKDLAPDLHEMKNVIMVSNPAVVNIHKSEDFPGFDVLLYHGYSFDYYVANVDSIRNAGGYHRADLLMEFFLKRRHLSPTHSSSPYAADPEKDHLIINKAPDFFVTGHIHYSSVSNYKNVTLICGSCWQGKTSFQSKTGHDPEPARVPLVNLQTRKVDILMFDDVEKENESE